jgi:geranylgeranyl diphosphate synthase type II
VLDQAVRYTLLAPGKRIRPLLTILAARELGADPLDALDAGCALEMVHAASLVLDDLPSMDDAPWRRGQPSTHVVFGEDTAILASIALLSRAYATVANAARVEPAARCALVTILARAVGADGLSGGQYQDLRSASPRELDCIADANHLKTGMLFVAGIEMAAAIAGVADGRLEQMRACATHIGQAFQLLDDLRDAGLHDPLGRSEDAGKATLQSILGQDEARERLARHVAHATACLARDGELADYIARIFVGFAREPSLAEGAAL